MSINFLVSFVSGSEDIAELVGGYVYIYDSAYPPMFPVQSTQLESLVGRVEALEKRLKDR